MWLLALSLRNLFRQKRRSLFLGSAMAIGVALLVLANAFSNGLSDIVKNKILRWVTGHVSIAFHERGRMMSTVFRDKQMFDFIAQEYSGLLLENEEAIGQMVRVIGNGRADNIIYIGLNPSAKYTDQAFKELDEQFHLVSGKWRDLNDSRFENPIILTVDKARYLNAKRLDTLRIRLRNVYGQDQSARVTVVGTMKIANIFMGAVTFGNVKQVKAILGYDAHSTGSINLVIKDPQKNAIKLADAIHDRLKPGLAAIYGKASGQGSQCPALILGFDSNSVAANKMAALLGVSGPAMEKVRVDKSAWVAEPLARQLGVQPGDSFRVDYSDKWGSPTGNLVVHVGGTFAPGQAWNPASVLLQDERFYEAYYDHLPPAVPATAGMLPDAAHPAWALLAPEFILLPRTATTEALEKKMKDMGKKKWHATLVDVQTMYETAEQVLKLQGVLNLITLVAVLVLFFIILIGVINSLRMTIRERTREIGTVRAIGMQQGDVRNLFVLETLLLALFAGIAGVIVAYAAMGVLSYIPMHMEDNPMGMFLVNAHLYFMPTWGNVLGNLVLILVLAGGTAYFPARRAAKLAPGAALRHFE
jgi:ABC-type lipoprotein release transport system permease subunit